MLIVYDPEDTHALHEPLTDVAMGLPSVYDDVPLRLHRVFDELKRIYGKPGIPKSDDEEGKDGTFMPYRDFGREPLLRVHDHAFIEYLERIWEQWVARGGNRETGVQPDTFHVRREQKPHGAPATLSNSSYWPVRLESWLSADAWRQYLSAWVLGTGKVKDDGYLKRSQMTLPRRGNPGLPEEGGNPGFYHLDFGAAAIHKDTWRAAYVAAQVALTAAEQLMMGRDRVAFAMCRPPGHHAHSDLVGGFCFLNNAAVAAQYIINNYGGVNVTILDVDYHHGNGTQEIFYHTANPKYISLHGMSDYPWFTGFADERGSGPGYGFNVNMPLPLETGDEVYCDALEWALEKEVGTWVPRLPHFVRDMVRKVLAIPQKPDVLVVSLGVDTFEDDPVGSFRLSTGCYRTIGKMLATVGVPTLFVMEGGYNVEKIGVLVGEVLQGFEEQAGAASSKS